MKPGMALLKNNEPDRVWFMSKSSIFEILPISHRRASKKP
jgi:hypothetical protein